MPKPVLKKGIDFDVNKDLYNSLNTSNDTKFLKSVGNLFQSLTLDGKNEFP